MSNRPSLRKTESTYAKIIKAVRNEMIMPQKNNKYSYLEFYGSMLKKTMMNIMAGASIASKIRNL